jgi:hypothetical protein
MAGLYSTFSTSQYYDTPPKPEKSVDKPTANGSFKKPHQLDPKDYGLTASKRQSLYAEAQKTVSTKSEYDHIDFKSMYRVGQMVAIQSRNGHYRTRKGRIVEIVNRDLMYVGMEDSTKDAHDHWLIDFVTSSDIITKI